MDKYLQAIEKSKKDWQLADHMLTVTYPLVKDTKLLLPIIEKIFLSMANAMVAVLYFDRMYKRIPAFTDTLEGKFNAFKQHCVHRHNMDKSYVADMHEIKTIIVERKKSPIEFVRKDRFVICNENYRIRTLSIGDIKSYLSKAKLFIEEMENIIKKNG